MLEENAFPVLAAILAAEDSAVFTRPERIADHRHIDQVRVGRMDANPGNIPGFLQTDMAPGLAAVRGLVGTVTPGNTVAQLRLARADIDDIRIAGSQRNGADRSHIDLAVGNRKPVLAVVLGHPYSARRMCMEKLVLVRRMHRNAAASHTDKRADAPPLHGAHRPVRLRIDLLRKGYLDVRQCSRRLFHPPFRVRRTNHQRQRHHRY